MGIYIPGMEMPCEGLMTIIAIGYDGRVFQPIEYPDEHTLYHGTKYNAIELPPHGRLIDADAFAAKYIAALPGGIDDLIDKSRAPEFVSQIQALLMDIAEAPTIIPADPEKEVTT